MSVTVVGSLNEDVLVAVGRLPGRGETVIGRSAELAPGGKGANQAAAAGRLGPGVHMVGRVGEDPAGDRQLAALADCPGERQPGAPHARACRPAARRSRSRRARGENLIVVVPGANARARARGRRRRVGAPRRPCCCSSSRCRWRRCGPPPRAATGTVVLNPAPPQPLPADLLGARRRAGAQRARAGAARGRRAGRADARASWRRWPARSPPCAVVVTLGARGALVVPADGAPLLQAPPPVTAGRHHRRRRLLLRRAGPGAGAGHRPAGRGPVRGDRGGAVDHRSRRPRRAARRRRRPGAAAAGAGRRPGLG